jgi:hypothetical protein
MDCRDDDKALYEKHRAKMAETDFSTLVREIEALQG